MALFTLSKLYRKLPEGKYAIGAFNVYNMEYVQAVITAAEKEKAPVILMIGEAIVPFVGLEMMANICLFAAKRSSIPVVVMLDHGRSINIIDKSIDLGLSVMFDGSNLNIKDNIKLTRKIVKKAHNKGVSVEGELGTIGGSEDNIKSNKNILMTDPDTALNFVEATGIDALAVAIGNCHGFYKGKVKLDITRLKEIRELINIPIVLHGGSGIPIKQAKLAINEGIKKFNIGTELKNAYAETMKKVLLCDPMPINPPEVLTPVRNVLIEIVGKKIRLFQSNNLLNFK